MTQSADETKIHDTRTYYRAYKIRELRTNARIAQSELAGICKVTLKEICSWENAETKPDPISCLTLAEISPMDRDVAYWLKESGYTLAQIATLSYLRFEYLRRIA